MTKKSLVGIAVLALGCGGSAPLQLQVEMLAVSGELAGRSLDGNAYTGVSGGLIGDTGTFTLDGPSVSVEIEACPLGHLRDDPYASAAGLEGGTAIVGVQCSQRALQVCDADGCSWFEGADVELAITDGNGWRYVATDASNAQGEVHVALRYREIP